MSDVKWPKANTRKGKKAVVVYLRDEAYVQLATMSAQSAANGGPKQSIEQLVLRGIDLLFAERGLPPAAVDKP